ncbi:unnamed protein product [Phytomonas sp. Hart1]|nr:unnamed protein product [Phytomonas sp. Hart1]|eukprot:CCW66337.1 unnamed protein product [Phytomonas sp. isolate Hart1]
MLPHKFKKNSKKGCLNDEIDIPQTSSQNLSRHKRNPRSKGLQEKFYKKSSNISDTQQNVFPLESPVYQLPDANAVSTWRYKDFFALVKAFVDNNAQELSLPSSLTGSQRKDVHSIAMIFNLNHKSHGTSTHRALKLTKPISQNLLQSQETTIAGSCIEKTEGYQGAQELMDYPTEEQLETSIKLMKKYWHNMFQALRAEAGRPEKPRKKMHMLQGGLSTPPPFRKNESRYQSLQKQRQSLPAFGLRDNIINILNVNDVVIVCGATGCGKTTQVPQIIFDAHIFPSDSIIVCTQPRRISAISVALRVAEERGEACGDSCGYVIRFENKTSPNTRIVYETTGILLRHLYTDPELRGVSCVIVDEVHERDLDTDFCLLLLKDRLVAQRRYPDKYPTKLKLVVMSATVKIESLVNYFSGTNTSPQVPLISIEGTLFPVDEYFLEDAIRWVNVPATSVPAMGLLRNGSSPKINNEGNDSEEESLYEKLRSAVFNDVERDAEAMVPYELVCKIIEYFHKKDVNRSGSILVFLPGWGAITRVHKMLYRLPIYRELYVLMLHSSLTSSEQQRVFLAAPKMYRKVVLATSIAETSITIDDVVYVIDSGLVKGTLYDPSSNLSSLKATLIAKANGKQRRGRAGRCQAGVCVHLLPTPVYDALQDFLPPEMMRSPLEEVCLLLKIIHPTEKCEAVLARAMDPPPLTSVQNAVQFLTEMGALTNEEQLTNLGYALAQLPVHPLLGKMLFASTCFGVLDSVATIAAGLSVKTLFVKPQPSEKMAAREMMKNLDKHAFSDHLCVRRVYCEWLRSGRSSHYATEHFADQSALYMLDRTKQQLINLVHRSPLLRQAKNPAKDASRHNENMGLVRLVVLWSLYPRIASIELHAKRKNLPPRVVCWDNKPSVFSMGSVLASAKRSDIIPTPFVMYYERMQLESTLTLFDSSCVSPLDVALCINQLTICSLSEIPESMIFDNESKMGPSSPLNLNKIQNKEDYKAILFDGGKKFYVTTNRVAHALKMARSCMDYYLALSIKKLCADVFPRELVCAIATLIGYPLSDTVTESNRFIGDIPGAMPAFTDNRPESVPSFIRGYKDMDFTESDNECNMIEVVSGDKFDEELPLTVDQKKYAADAYGNLAVLCDDEAFNFLVSAQGNDFSNEAKLDSATEANKKSSSIQDQFREQESDDDEDIIIANPGDLVIN